MIEVECPSCHKRSSLPDSAAGKQAKCGCGMVFPIPAAQQDLLPLMPTSMPSLGAAPARQPSSVPPPLPTTPPLPSSVPPPLPAIAELTTNRVRDGESPTEIQSTCQQGSPVPAPAASQDAGNLPEQAPADGQGADPQVVLLLGMGLVLATAITVVWSGSIIGYILTGILALLAVVLGKNRLLKIGGFASLAVAALALTCQMVSSAITWFNTSWERENKAQIIALAAEVGKLQQAGNYRRAAEESDRIVELVGDRQLQDKEIAQFAKSARVFRSTAAAEIKADIEQEKVDKVAAALADARRLRNSQDWRACLGKCAEAIKIGATVDEYSQRVQAMLKEAEASKKWAEEVQRNNEEVRAARQRRQQEQESKQPLSQADTMIAEHRRNVATIRENHRRNAETLWSMMPEKQQQVLSIINAADGVIVNRDMPRVDKKQALDGYDSRIKNMLGTNRYIAWEYCRTEGWVAIVESVVTLDDPDRYGLAVRLQILIGGDIVRMVVLGPDVDNARGLGGRGVIERDNPNFAVAKSLSKGDIVRFSGLVDISLKWSWFLDIDDRGTFDHGDIPRPSGRREISYTSTKMEKVGRVENLWVPFLGPK